MKYVRPLTIPVTLAVLTLIFMMAFVRTPTGREALNGDDLIHQQYPLFSFIFDSVRDGHGLPLWNPYQFAGQSVAGNPQSTIFYPPAWIMVPLGVPLGVGWLITIHLWLGGWGMAQFARQLGATMGGAFVGAIVYEFSALFGSAITSGHFNYLICQAWLPWVAAAYLWSLKRHWFWAALPGVALLGACILTGYPPLLYFLFLWLFSLWIYASWRKRSMPLRQIAAGMLRALRPLLVIGIGGAVLGAAMLLPVGQLTLQSTRTGEASLAFSNSYAMPGGQLITFMFPNLFGYPSLPDLGYWGVPFYQESTAYFGIVPLIAIALIQQYRRRRAAVLMALFVIVGLIVSIGIDGGLFSTLYWLLPGYSLFRVPSKSLYFVVVGAAGLTALLISKLQLVDQSVRVTLLRFVTRWLLPLLGAFAVITSLALMSYFTAHSTDQDPPWRILYSGNIVGIAIVAIMASWIAFRLWQTGQRIALPVTVLVLMFDLWHISQPLVTVSAIDVPDQWKTIASVVPASPDYRVMTVPYDITWQAGVMYTHHLNANGYDPLVSSAYQLLLDASQNNPTSPISHLLGVRYAITAKPYDWLNLPGIDQLTLLANKNGWYIYEVHNPLPRVFVVSHIEVDSDSEAVRQQLALGSLDPLMTVTVDRSVECPTAQRTADATSQARIVGYEPNTVDVDATGAGLLVLTDSYDSNWTVTVDNLPTSLLRVDTALRGVCLSEGTHRVHFAYQPKAFIAGVVVSVVGWAILGILCSVRLVTKRLLFPRPPARTRLALVQHIDYNPYWILDL